MRRSPTERQAALAARQLHYHRERLRWIRDRMRDNERLLRERLEESGERRLVLPGGYAVARAENGRLVVGQLPAPASRFEQLELYVIHAVEVAHEGRRSR